MKRAGIPNTSSIQPDCSSELAPIVYHQTLRTEKIVGTEIVYPVPKHMIGYTNYVENQVTKLVQNYITTFMNLSDISKVSRTRMGFTPLYASEDITKKPLLPHSHLMINGQERKPQPLWSGACQIDAMNDALGGPKLICAFQVTILAVIFEKNWMSPIEKLYQFNMSGVISLPMDSVVYVKQYDNMHFGMGFKPIMMMNRQDVIECFDSNDYETISRHIYKRLPWA